MDPITTAIVLALGKLGENVILDSYNALKAAIAYKCGLNSNIVKAIDELEKKPDSTGRKETLKEEIAASKVSRDDEILNVAKSLLDKIEAQSDGKQTTQGIQRVVGDKNIFSNTGDVNVGDVDLSD